MRLSHSKQASLWLLIGLGIVYILVRTAWYDAYPPTRNYDHFNTQATLNVLRDSSVYPTDPIWKDGGQARSLGILFLGALRLGDAVFGGYVESWTAFYFIHLLIYLPGAFLLFRALMREDWLAGLVAVASSLPFYLYFSYTHWGITSPYATTFTTAQVPWLFFGLMHLLAHNKAKLWQWAGLGLYTSSLIFWNPVNGLILIQICGFILLIEWLSGRIGWRVFGIFVGMCAASIVVYYLSSSGSAFSSAADVPLTEAETQAIILEWKAYVGQHFYPWTAEETLAFRIVIASLITGLLFVLSAPLAQLGRTQAWWVIGLVVLMCQVPIPIMMARDSSFLLMVGYWVYRYRRIDRWDILWLAVLTASNLGGNVQAAIAYHLFAKREVLAMASFAFESLRNTRFAFLVLFVFAGRWCADLLRYGRKHDDVASLAAIPFILGSVLSRIGHVGLDDTVIVRPFDENLRLHLPLMAFWLAFIGRVPWLNRVHARNLLTLPLTGLGLFLAVGFAQNIKPQPFDNPSAATGVILLLLLVGLGFWARTVGRGWPVFIVLSFLLVIVPISSYTKAHDNYNLEGGDHAAIAHWARTQTPKDTLFLMPDSWLDPSIYPMYFRAESQRSIMAWDVLQSYFFLGPREMLASNELFWGTVYALDPNNPDDLRAKVESLSVDYLIVRREFSALPYPVAFETPSAIVYHVMTTPP